MGVARPDLMLRKELARLPGYLPDALCYGWLDGKYRG